MQGAVTHHLLWVTICLAPLPRNHNLSLDRRDSYCSGRLLAVASHLLQASEEPVPLPQYREDSVRAKTYCSAGLFVLGDLQRPVSGDVAMIRWRPRHCLFLPDRLSSLDFNYPPSCTLCNLAQDPATRPLPVSFWCGSYLGYFPNTRTAVNQKDE